MKHPVTVGIAVLAGAALIETALILGLKAVAGTPELFVGLIDAARRNL